MKLDELPNTLPMSYATEFMPGDELLAIGEVGRIVKKSTPTIYRLIRNNQFPSFIKVAGRSLWLRSEIIRYLSNCVEERNNHLEEIENGK